MMDTFQPQAVKLHYHGETFDTKQEIHEISDAWLIAADVMECIRMTDWCFTILTN